MICTVLTGDALVNALKSTTASCGNPYYEGATFMITNEKAGSQFGSRIIPAVVLEDILTHGKVNVAIPTLIDPKTTSDGKVLTPSGDFNMKVAEICRQKHADKASNDDLLEAIIKAFKDKTLKVNARYYERTAYTVDGAKYSKKTFFPDFKVTGEIQPNAKKK